MAFSFVTGSNKRASGTSTSPSVTLASTAAGNLGIALLRINSSSVTASSPAVGSQTLTATPKSPLTQGSGPIRIYLYYILNLTGSQTACTVTLSGSVSWVLAYAEYSWGGSAGTFDQDQSGNAASGGSLSVTSFTPATANSLAVSGGSILATGGAWTAGSGYTIATSGTGQVSGSDAIEHNLALTAADTAPISNTVGGVWVELAAVFAPAGGATFQPEEDLWAVPMPMPSLSSISYL